MRNTQWAVDGDQWQPVKGKMVKTLRPGLYELQTISNPFGPSTVFLKTMKSLESDKIMSLPGSLAEYIVSAIETFWSQRKCYADMGLIHKRGLLMEGLPGTGKTAICLLAGREIAKRGGVAVFNAPTVEIGVLPRVLKTIREVHPDLALLNIMEDIDKHRRQMDVLLPMLDGENQISNIVHIATTNFVDRLDARLTNRPSRFDEVIKVRPPAKRARAAYLASVLPADVSTSLVKEMTTASRQLNFAHLKELAICTYVYGRPIDKTVERLRCLAENRGTGFDKEEDDEGD